MELKEAQKQWSFWKYYVMSRSQKEYLTLRQLFSGNQWNEEKSRIFWQTIEEVKRMTPTIGSLKNTYQHIWGYFKKFATLEEKQDFQKMFQQLEQGEDVLLPFFQSLSKKYEIDYLLTSKFLFEQSESEH